MRGRQGALPSVAVLVLNHNGRDLLAWGLPSVLEEAARYPGQIIVIVVDNASTDGSVEMVKDNFPDAQIVVHSNEVLVSYNDVARDVDTDAILLLNNDMQVAPGSFVALAECLSGDVFAVAAQTRSPDQRFESGRYRAKLIRGLVRFERSFDQEASGWTSFASGGACLVDRVRFLAVGGFDPIYLPGYLEDADLGFRAWASGWTCWYTPSAVVTHLGSATFSRSHDAQALDRLFLRNEIVFAWKNVPYRGRIIAWGIVRLVAAPFKGRLRVVIGAVRDALGLRSEIDRQRGRPELLQASQRFQNGSGSTV